MSCLWLEIKMDGPNDSRYGIKIYYDKARTAFHIVDMGIDKYIGSKTSVDGMVHWIMLVIAKQKTEVMNIKILQELSRDPERSLEPHVMKKWKDLFDEFDKKFDEKNCIDDELIRPLIIGLSTTVQ